MHSLSQLCLALAVAIGLLSPAVHATPGETQSASAVLLAQARPNTKQQSKSLRRKQTAQAQQEAERRAAEERQRVKEEQVKELLGRAQRDYAAGRLIEPAINNAADRYKEALALDPTNLEALAGAQRIADILAEETKHAAAAGDVTRTRLYIAQIRALQPDDPALLELEARLNALLSSPVVLSARQQERYDRSAQSIEKANQALQNQRLDMDAIDLAMEEYDRAANLVPQAPGLPMLKDRIIVAFPAATRLELASDNSKRALKVVQMARKRGWFSPELELLETRAKETLDDER